MQKSKPLKLVIDTNLWISFLISNRVIKIDSLLVSGELKILFSKELLEEIQAVIIKPKLRKYFSTTAMEEMLSALEPYIDIIEVKTRVSVCRDNKDNFLLALSKDGGADYLLSGDKDLLTIKKYGKTQILTLTAFLQKSNASF